MSVPLSERSLSKMEFYNNAVKLRNELTEFFLRDFGLKSRIVEVEQFCNKQGMTQEDKESFQNLMSNYNMGEYVLEEFPHWLIEDEREFFNEKLRELIMNITLANTIYITTQEEYTERRRLLTLAIGNCNQILQELQHLVPIFKIDINKLMRYVDKIDFEISLLKGVRKSDNQKLKNVLNKKKT